MGYVEHHAIIVTGYAKEDAEAAHAFVASTGASVSSVAQSNINGDYTFVVGPDGSKSGWEEDAEGDIRRATIKGWLRSETKYQWVEVSYGFDPGGATIVDSAWHGVSK